jgi:SAM-dependent methyltransferase
MTSDGMRGASDGDRARRWGDRKSYQPSWDARAEAAARMLPDGASILEIGVGAGAFRALVAGRHPYLGADLAPLDPETLPLDLDIDPLPAGPFDVVVMLGVMEYLHSPEQALQKARASGRRALFSYCCLKASADRAQIVRKRRERRWINDWSRDELIANAERAGWRLAREEPFNEDDDFHQAIFMAEPSTKD